MTSTEPVLNNTDKWIASNSQFFLPPVCNKMMHNDGQMRSFYVGGPNHRKDYHMEEGEELFYMVKGDMVLKVVENNTHRDVIIKEGEIFLLPAYIAHSPQRQADTVGFVIERDRADEEFDGLRYFVEDAEGTKTLESLYEDWFHCEDLGSQLGPIINAYFASEQHKTGKPTPGTIPEIPPVKLNSNLTLQEPFHLATWIDKNREELNSKGQIKLFQRDDHTHQFQVYIHGKGEASGQTDVAEVFIWLLEGSSSVTTGDQTYSLAQGDNILIRQGQKYTISTPDGGIALVCWQDPTLKKKIE